jgi:hypothetical protein
MTLTAPDDVRVAAAKPLLPPAVLLEEIPLSEKAQKSVQKVPIVICHTHIYSFPGRDEWSARTSLRGRMIG